MVIKAGYSYNPLFFWPLCLTLRKQMFAEVFASCHHYLLNKKAPRAGLLIKTMLNTFLTLSVAFSG